MKAMCIKDGQWKNEFGHNPNGPKYGEEVTIIGESENHPDSWILFGYEYDSSGILHSYHKCHFIPLSEIDETELAEQRLQTA